MVNQHDATVATPRVSAGVIFTDDQSQVLMLRTTYKAYWDVPGGYVEPGESPRAAAEREVSEELGLNVSLGRMLAVDWAPSERKGDKLLFLFAGPKLAAAAAFTFRDGEIAETRYVAVDQLGTVTIDRLARRIRSAVGSSTPVYLEHGAPVTQH